jgi:hypothetical protein
VLVDEDRGENDGELGNIIPPSSRSVVVTVPDAPASPSGDGRPAARSLLTSSAPAELAACSSRRVLDETGSTPRRRSADATVEKYASTAGLDRELAPPRNKRSDRAAGVIVVDWVGDDLRVALCPRARVCRRCESGELQNGKKAPFVFLFWRRGNILRPHNHSHALVARIKRVGTSAVSIQTQGEREQEDQDK